MGRVAVPLRGVPSGLVAVTIPRRSDGKLRVPRDRKGRLKPRRVDLIAVSPKRSGTPVDEPWLFGANRRAWASVVTKCGSGAWDTACAMARDGLIEIRCTVAGAAMGEPVAILLTEHARAARAARTSTRTETAIEWSARAHVAADAVQGLDSGLAVALRVARGTEPRLPVLVFAAEDLVAGRAHDGPRAFSQVHFGHTKQRDDAPSLLLAAGASPETIAALGLERSPYLGLGGPVRVGDINLGQFRGPVLFRARDPALIHASSQPTARALVVVENLQAAENVCDTRGDVVVAYSAGPPSEAALDVIIELTVGIPRVLVVPDADLGGVRIAERILSALHTRTPADVELVDVGTEPHERREAFAAATLAALKAATAGAATKLARAVLDRGYPVEQEAATRAALTAFLGPVPRNRPATTAGTHDIAPAT